MNVIEATWEKRNLGMPAWEVVLNALDCADVKSMIKAMHDDRFVGAYVCVKMPVACLTALHALEDDGFRFVEAQFQIKDCFDPSAVMRTLEKLADRFDRRTVPHDMKMWRDVCAKITPGMFTTDRVALDPMFGPEIACRRYQNWIMDLCSNPEASLEITSVNGVDVAFSLKKSGDGKSSSGILGGVFEPYKEAGYGAVSMLDKWARGRGEKRRTVISSNNIDVLKIHQNCGRIVYGVSYVLRKIYNG